MNYFKYGKKEIEYLKEKDPILGAAIKRIGMVKREVDSDVFSSLISSIIGQQISTKSALTVRKRLINIIGEITPDKLDKITVEDIQKCGMSMRKAQYIKGITEATVSKIIDFEKFHKLSDEQIMRELTSLKGVGEWTAEMLLIHSLQRPNILSFKDLGIRRGIMKLYNLEDLTRKQFQTYKNRYSPYGTVASIYIWEVSSKEKNK